MARVRVKLLRPLNGAAVGSESTYNKDDAEELERKGCVEILGKAKASEDGEDGANAEDTSADGVKMEEEPENKMAADHRNKRGFVEAPRRRSLDRSSKG